MMISIENLKKMHSEVSQAELDLAFASSKDEKIAQAACNARLATLRAAEKIRELINAHSEKIC